jgi:hypothetical protein
VKAKTIAVSKIVAPGMASIWTAHYGVQPWVGRTARKATRCAATGRAICPGERVYAPLGNPMNRSMRVLASWVEEQ